jgi:hypothetical protein
MKYFLDTEFLEGPQQESFPISLFRKQTPPTIDLISIGIVAEDGREYYAISKDFNLKEAWNRYDIRTMTNLPGDMSSNKMKVYWIRENVLLPIYNEMLEKWNKDTVYYIGDFSYKTFKYLLKIYGKTNKEIAEEVKHFCHCEFHLAKSKGSLDFTKQEAIPEFYAYFADHDCFVFCWLFGKMMDLPKGFPMYCNDLKQELDSLVRKQIAFYIENKRPEEKPSFEAQLNYLKTKTDYPKQENEHDALADARWNKKLYEFLNKL